MPSTPARTKTEPAAVRFYGAAHQLLHSHDPEILIAGPAGTGKSLSVLMKAHVICETKPGVRALMVRKTRASLSESALATFERDVLPESHPARRGSQRSHRHSYNYPNGSQIILGGMDRASRIMSTEFDLIFVQEATELDENDWESLSSRLRNNKLKFQQLIGDCNPSFPTHWLRQRCLAGRTVLLESKFEDNPLLFDAGANDWTEFGRTYIDRLDRLTGVRKERLRYGRWAAAEGLIYTDWSERLHLIDRFRPPPDWRRLWVCDFGFVNAFAWQLWAIDGDGRMYLTKEIYKTGTLVEDHAKAILAATQNEPRPVAIVTDHDAEDAQTLAKHLGMTTTRANKNVSAGIQAVQSRLRPAGDGRPRLFVMRDALRQRDPALVEAKLPTCLAEEITGYVWDPGKKSGEAPVKLHDHAMDAMRYAAAFLDLKGGPPGSVRLLTFNSGGRRPGESIREPRLRIAVVDRATLAGWEVGEEHAGLLINFAPPDGDTALPPHKIANLLDHCTATFPDVVPTEYDDEQWTAPIAPWNRPGSELLLDANRDIGPVWRFVCTARHPPPKMIVFVGTDPADRRPETAALTFADRLGCGRGVLFRPGQDWSCNMRTKPPNTYLAEVIRHHFFGWMPPRAR